MVRSRDQKGLFTGLNRELRFRLNCGLTWDEAIETLKDKIAELERLRDRNVDPKSKGILQ